MAVIQPGALAPDFTLETDTGEKVTLSAFRGKNVVLFFYPKAGTPGCTTEVCEFRDAETAITKTGTVILGISPDTVKAQAKFKTKFGLPYALVADAERQTAEAYGVWTEKSMYGKTYMGVARTTFLIDAGGQVTKVFEKVRAGAHAGEVLAALQAM